MRKINEIAIDLLYQYLHIKELEKELTNDSLIKFPRKFASYTESLKKAKEKYKELIVELKKILIEKNTYSSPLFSYSVYYSLKNNLSVSILLEKEYEVYNSLVITNPKAFIKDEVNPEQYLSFNEVICLGKLQEIIDKQKDLLQELQTLINNQR